MGIETATLISGLAAGGSLIGGIGSAMGGGDVDTSGQEAAIAAQTAVQRQQLALQQEQYQRAIQMYGQYGAGAQPGYAKYPLEDMMRVLGYRTGAPTGDVTSSAYNTWLDAGMPRGGGSTTGGGGTYTTPGATSPAQSYADRVAGPGMPGGSPFGTPSQATGAQPQPGLYRDFEGNVQYISDMGKYAGAPIGPDGSIQAVNAQGMPTTLTPVGSFGGGGGTTLPGGGGSTAPTNVGAGGYVSPMEAQYMALPTYQGALQAQTAKTALMDMPGLGPQQKMLQSLEIDRSRVANQSQQALGMVQQMLGAVVGAGTGQQQTWLKEAGQSGQQAVQAGSTALQGYQSINQLQALAATANNQQLSALGRTLGQLGTYASSFGTGSTSSNWGGYGWGAGGSAYDATGNMAWGGSSPY